MCKCILANKIKMIQFTLISNYFSELDASMKEWQLASPVLPDDEIKEELTVLRKIPASRLPFRLKKSCEKQAPKSSH